MSASVGSGRRLARRRGRQEQGVGEGRARQGPGRGLRQVPAHPHVVWLGGSPPRGDKLVAGGEVDEWLRQPMSVEEKVDGANLGLPPGRERASPRAEPRHYLSARPGAGTRSPSTRAGRSTPWGDDQHGTIGNSLPLTDLVTPASLSGLPAITAIAARTAHSSGSDLTGTTGRGRARLSLPPASSGA